MAVASLFGNDNPDIRAIGTRHGEKLYETLLGREERQKADDRGEYFAQLADWKADSVASSWHGSGAWRDGLLSADYVVER